MSLIEGSRVLTLREALELIHEAERIDREMGYPLPGDSALAVCLTALDQALAEAGE